MPLQGAQGQQAALFTGISSTNRENLATGWQQQQQQRRERGRARLGRERRGRGRKGGRARL